MDASIRTGKLHDIVHFGVRFAVGVIFIAHGVGKFDPGFAGFLAQLGIPAEMQVLIALAETVPGIMLIFGVLSRIASSILALIMVNAIFYVKKAGSLTGQGGYEIDLILLAANLTIIVLGPGRISISHVAKRIPRFLQ